MSINETETPAPGTGGAMETPTPTDQSAETLNTDTSQSGPPEAVPYSRFKEVNDRLNQLKPYASLEELGYDPDSLGQLAAFEQSFIQDEVGTLQKLVTNSEVLTESQKAEMMAALEGNILPNNVERDDSHSDEDEPPEWARPILEERETRLQREKEESATAYLDNIMVKWDEADAADKLVPTPKSVKLAFIAANAPHAKSVDQLVEVCRQMTKEYQTSILTDAVTPASGGLSGSPPRAVPGGGVPVPTPTPLRNMKDATAAARSAIEAGQLPMSRR